MQISKQPFGQMPDGRQVDLFTLTNDNEMTAKITNYGGILVSLIVPDRDGRLGDVVLGFDSLDGYLGPHPFFGSLVGRYANRIGGARFQLNGVEYPLAQNQGSNHLHGGLKGFDKVVWEATEISDAESVGLRLTYLSVDSEEGYPGNLSVDVTYTLNNQNALQIAYTATTDQTTILNLTNHSYFNLAETGDILNHEVMINADYVTPTDTTQIPTGELQSVAGTPFDFRISTKIGERIDADDPQLQAGQGYDHNWVLNNPDGGLCHAAQVNEPTTGRTMDVYTTQPGVQFYTGNVMQEIVGKEGQGYNKRYGFCLETQHYPDSPNQPDFPSVVLAPGEQFSETTVFQFS